MQGGGRDVKDFYLIENKGLVIFLSLLSLMSLVLSYSTSQGLTK